MSDLLKIGVSSCFFHPNPERPIFKNKTLLYFEESMARMVLSYGAIPLTLPRPFAGMSVRDILEQVDGLLLQGGSDVCPASYGEEPIRPEWEGDLVRDEYEIDLVRESISMNKPVLGICRGLQILNVTLGGTLYQDIPTQIEGAQVHRNWDIYEGLTHEVEMEPETHLEQLYREIPERKVISIHHQAVRDMGEGLILEARSKKDNIIEALRYREGGEGGSKESETAPYACGVQWHPEFQNTKDPTFMSHAPMIKDFLKAVKNRKLISK